MIDSLLFIFAVFGFGVGFGYWTAWNVAHMKFLREADKEIKKNA